MARVRGVGLMLAFATACGGASTKVAAPLDPSAKVVSTPVVQPLKAQEQGAPEDDAVVPIYASDPTWGDRDALVTIVEFSDFQCPFCGRVEPTLAKLKETYGPKQLRIVWKNEPLSFHPNAKPAAEAAMAVFAHGGNDAFWKWHDAAFAHQQELAPDAYERWATDAGVDARFVHQALESHEFAKKVEADNTLGSKLGVNGTPGFLINGVLVSGAQPIDRFKEVVDAELTQAKDLFDKGTPPARVYAVATAENFKAIKDAEAAEDADREAKEREEAKKVFKVPVGTSPSRGKADAEVTIVEFSDFQCPFCKRVEPTLDQVRQTYGDKVRIVWKNEPLPFHPRAEPAAELALAARAQKGDAGFWEVHDALFASQPKLEDADLKEIATNAHLDVTKALAAIKDHKFKSSIEADANLADDVAANGTPHFFINGRRLVGAQPFDKFQAIIDEEIQHAKNLAASGTPKSGIYAAIIKDGQETMLERKPVALPTHSPVRGNAAAKVTIQEFADFQCPFCERVDATLDKVMTDYGSRVKLVWRNMPLPFHKNAPLAAEAAMEAFAQKGNAGFWKMHDLLFTNQATPDGLLRPALDGYAAQIGLDMAKFAKALDGETHKDEIAADEKAAHDAHITGTPAFVVNGYFINGAQPYAAFHRAIEHALAEANGTSPKRD